MAMAICCLWQWPSYVECWFPVAAAVKHAELPECELQPV